jgi:hypothetical protein
MGAAINPARRNNHSLLTLALGVKNTSGYVVS